MKKKNSNNLTQEIRIKKFGIDILKKRLTTWKNIRPRGYKTYACSIQLDVDFIMLIKVKMPTIVGILTLISMIKTTNV